VTDRTVTVRLKADIGDFVTDIGVKAPAAVNRLERAADSANKKLATVGSKTGFDDLGSKADTAAAKLTKTGTAADAAGKQIGNSAKGASSELDKLSKSSKDVGTSVDSMSKSMDKASKVTDAHANALGRLRVAQLRLADAQKSGKGGTALASAEESLASAERAVKKFEKAGDDSGKGFLRGIAKWFTGAGSGGIKVLGEEAVAGFNNGFLSGLSGLLKTPVIGPIILAALLAAAVSVAAPVGAVLAGGVVTAFGAGLGALGLVFAAKSEVVKSIWAKTTADLGAQTRSIAKPFETTLSAMAIVAERTFAKLKPELAAAFKTLGPALSGFGDQLGQALGKLAPAIQPLAGAFSKILGSLGPALNSVFAQLSSSLTKLSASISKNPTALADFAKGIGGLVSDILRFLSIMNDADGAFKRWTGGVSAVTALMGTLRAAVFLVLGPIEGLAKVLGGVGDGTRWLAGRLGIYIPQADQSAASTSKLADSLAKAAAEHQAHAAAALHNAHATHEANTAAALLAGAYDRQAAATQKAVDALNRESGILQTLAGAQISYQQALDDTTAAIKANGATHDINTQKGRDNKTALLQLAAAATAQRDAMLKGGDGTVKAAGFAEASQRSFIKLAEQMHYGKAEAEAMAASLIAIPNVTRTARLQANITDLEAKLATARERLKDPKLTATQRAKLEAKIDNLLAGIKTAKDALAGVPASKTVAITVNTYKNLVETTTHKDVGVRVPAPKVNANGGFYPYGVIPSYADGKLPQQATIAPGKGRGMVQWAEQETGGEAFIPLAPSKRDRSEKILGQVANKFGMSMVKSFASGGILPGSGQLVDISYILSQLNIPFNPLAGINYSGTLAAANRANRATIAPRDAALQAQKAEAAAKAQVAAIQRAITLQQRAVAAARAPKQTTKAGQAAEDKRVAAEQKKLIELQDELYAAKNKATAATKASSAADAAYKVKVDAATKANEAHKASIQALIEQQKAAVQFAQQISDSLQQGANIGDLFQKSLTGKGLLSDLQAQGADLAKFNTLVTKLRKAGLDEGLIQQIVGKGASGGTDVAQAILSGGLALINSLNKAQWALENQANQIGAGSATAQYGAQVTGRRAKGGSTLPGKDYVVGEEGPEVLRMGVQRGWVEPNRYVMHQQQPGVQKVVNQYNTFQGVSMAEADLIASRANAKAEFAARS
jgi:hypothetical protein